ncbi:MAG TPA: cytidine deaminase [Terriglobales bacterium]|nr:cytidine deaminase [Terriglobales bacterium]
MTPFWHGRLMAICTSIKSSLQAYGDTPLSTPSVPATPPVKLSAEERKLLIDAARQMLDRAYAPYSKFHVGCAVLTEAGNVYPGCNVENVSYGITICAERSAISAAVAAEGPKMKLRAVAVLNSTNLPCSPCGACRQVIYEFGPKALVIYQGEGKLAEATAEQLLPAGFHF